MKKVERNEVDFSEIFHFAEQKFGIGWNKANDVFFRSETLDYKRYNDFEREELAADLEPGEWRPTGDNLRACQIILAFMVDNNIETMRVMNG